MNKLMLENKVAIISGASYGMGQTMAELFASEGAKVVMTARGQDKLDAAVAAIRSKGYDVTGVVADNKNLDDVIASTTTSRHSSQQCGHTRPDRENRNTRLGCIPARYKCEYDWYCLLYEKSHRVF